MRYPETTAPITAPTPVAAPAFSAGSVIGRSFSIWFRNFVPFSIVTLAVHVPVLVLAALAPADGGPGWGLAESVLSVLAGFVVTGALTYGVIASLRGGRAGAGALFSTGFRSMARVFLVSFGVGMWMLLGVILLVVPAVVWYCALYVAIPAVVMEQDRESTDALDRSRALTKGHRWAIFAAAATVFVVTVLVAGAGGLLVVLLQALPHPIPALLATAVVALVSGLGACAAAVAYHDLRVAKEGVTTEQLAKVFE